MPFVKSTPPLTRSLRFLRAADAAEEKSTRLMQGLVSYGMVLDVIFFFASAYLDLLDM